MLSEKARLALSDIHHNTLLAQIMGIGNVLRHNYADVVETIIWKTAQDSLAPLLAVVIAEMSIFEVGP